MPRWTSLFLVAAGIASCTSPARDSEPAAQPPTCEAWRALPTEGRTYVIGASLTRQVGHPRESPLGDCLWAISDQIAQHVFDLCGTDREYGEAVSDAFRSAIDFCTARGAGKPPPRRPIDPQP
jgi:hypothetical protein